MAVLAAGAAWAVWQTVPDGIRPPALTGAAWRQTLTHPLLMGMVGVTALSAAGQFTLFSYFAPYYRQALGASALGVSLLFLWFGAFGLLGNVLLQRWVDRVGAARCVAISLVAMAFSQLLWPLAGSALVMAAVLTPWALGCFASNSAQQARLGAAAPALAPALMALNTSAMYLGQAIGAAGGGAMVAAQGFQGLNWVALAWMGLAVLTSLWLAKRMASAWRL